MIAEITAAGTLVWLSIVVKTLAYAATLTAIGSPLALYALGSLDENDRSFIRRVAMGSSAAAMLFSALRIPLQAIFLIGGEWSGAWNATILSIVAEGPLGLSVALRAVGLLMILTLALRHRAAQPLALAGAVVAALSFALRGHALEEPRLILAAVLTVHILCLGFWVAALPPIFRATFVHDPRKAGAVAHEFGTIAIWAVAGLISAGVAMLAVFGVLGPRIGASPYGQGFLVKLALFGTVLGFAAWNRLVLTPRLRSGETAPLRRLRRSVGAEVGAIGLVLLTTATVTTVSAPG